MGHDPQRDEPPPPSADELRRLRQDAAAFEALVGSFPDLYFLVDEEGTIVDYRANRALELYVPPEVFLGRRMWEVLPREPGELISAAVRRAFALGSLVRVEYELPMAGGVEIYEARVAPAPAGRVATFVRNITAARRASRALEETVILLRAAEEERARALEDARQAIQVREEFLSIASHELRTPLTSLLLALQSLPRLAELSPAASLHPRFQEVLSTAVRQGHVLAELVNQLLSVARIQAGRLELRPEEVDLASVAQEALSNAAEELAQAGCVVTLTAVPIRGRWDRSRLLQVATNLLTNAARYAAGRPVDVLVDEEGGQARLQVTDRGPGVPLQLHARIFERFERVSSTTYDGGLGLGLYISRQIVEAHGGTIAVASVPGSGATFTVRLPLR